MYIHTNTLKRFAMMRFMHSIKKFLPSIVRL